MLLMLIALAVPPVLVVYGFSLFFLNATIDNWFNVRLEQGLADALEIGRVYLDERLGAAESKSQAFAGELAQRARQRPAGARRCGARRAGGTQLTVFGDNRTILATASSDPRFLSPAYPDAAVLLQVRTPAAMRVAEPLGDDGTAQVARRRAACRVGPGAPRLLQARFPVSDAIRPLTAEVEKASFDFQRLKFLRDSLKLTFTLVLTFVLLLSALFAVLMAFGVARRLTAPIGRLATATRAVGAGRYDYAAADCRATTNWASCLTSFGQMQRQLELADASRAPGRARNRRSARLPQAVLEHLTSGVLGLDREGMLRTANRAAETILQRAVERLHRPAPERRARRASGAGAADRSDPQARRRGLARMARGSRRRAGRRTPCADAAWRGAGQRTRRQRRRCRRVRRPDARSTAHSAKRPGPKSRGAWRTRSRIR